MAIRPAVLLLLLLAPATRADTLVYSNDFEAKPGTTFPEWTSGRVAFESRQKPPSSGAREAAPVAVVEWPKGRHRRFLGEFGGPRVDPTARTRVKQTVRLALRGLAPHAKVTVSFDLLVLRSWDGDSPGYGPDRFRLAVAGGAMLLDTTFSNNPKVDSDRSLQSYPKPGSPPRTGAASTGSLDDGFFRDSIYRLTFAFAHSADSLTLEFASDLFEGKGTEDEAWGLDDVAVRTDADASKPKPTAATKGLTTFTGAEAIMERERSRGDKGGTTITDGHNGQNGDAPRFTPRRDTDERGRLLPMTDEQHRARIEEGNRMLDEMAKIVDETDTDEIWDQVLRNLGVDPATGRGLDVSSDV